MVRGIDSFRMHFADYTDRYVLIGGTASTLAMEELGVEFRATNDLDIVLCVEALDSEFGAKFWEYVHRGGYETRQKSTGKRLFYRFHSPKDATFPVMLKLFSRIPDALSISEDAHLTPIPVGEDVSSLSAILLDEAYYGFIHECRREVTGLSIIGAECLIPLKARAYIDLHDRKQAGEQIDSRDIKKHKNDIFRLFTVLDLNQRPKVPDQIRADLTKAFALLREDPVDLKALKVIGTSTSVILSKLETFYGLEATFS